MKMDHILQKGISYKGFNKTSHSKNQGQSHSKLIYLRNINRMKDREKVLLQTET